MRSSILGDVVNTVKLVLGLQEMEVWAELYNLLLYKPGDHFKPHTDREKMVDLFSTLRVQLLTEFTGGEVHWEGDCGEDVPRRQLAPA